MRYVSSKFLIAFLLLLAAGGSARAEFISSQQSQNSSGATEGRSNTGNSGPAIIVTQNSDYFDTLPVAVFFSTSNPTENGGNPVPSARDRYRPDSSEQGFGGAGSSVPGGSTPQSPIPGAKPAVSPPQFTSMLFTHSQSDLPDPLVTELFHPPRP